MTSEYTRQVSDWQEPGFSGTSNRTALESYREVPAEARPQSARRPRRQHAPTPEWTDDLTIPLPPPVTVEQLIETVVQAALSQTSEQRILGRLARDFGLSRDDAALAHDRVHGGLLRAATGDPRNRPDPLKDPVAAEAIDRGTRDPTLVTRIHPEFRSGD